MQSKKSSRHRSEQASGDCRGRSARCHDTHANRSRGRARSQSVDRSTSRGSELHPVTLDDGKHVFDPAEVRAVARTRARRGAASATGELAARACELFREGRGSIDVIIALRQSFDIVLEWQRKYVAERHRVIENG